MSYEAHVVFLLNHWNAVYRKNYRHCLVDQVLGIHNLKTKEFYFKTLTDLLLLYNMYILNLCVGRPEY